MQIKRNLNWLIVFALICVFAGCRENIVPKPRGHFRIDFPQKAYRLYDTVCPFSFEYPVYGKISYNVGKITEPCWFNIEFPNYRAKIYLSYKRINNNLAEILDESHEFAYSHSIKADVITEKPWLNPDNSVYGIMYDIKGNTASAVQFFVTDSTKNFLRGALYFSSQPNEDSLSPVIDFFREDIIHLVETLKWK